MCFKTLHQSALLCWGSVNTSYCDSSSTALCLLKKNNQTKQSFPNVQKSLIAVVKERTSLLCVDLVLVPPQSLIRNDSNGKRENLSEVRP